jgi:hypothetical protein
MLVVLTAALAGCNGRASLFPNPDPQLRKDSTQFAADAAAHHPYKADAPRGGKAQAQAAVNYGLDDIVVVNLSQEDWKDAEIWVNRKYEVTVPVMPKGAPDKPAKGEKLFFQLIFDEAGNHFPTSKERVEKLELYCNGKMYDVPCELSD